MNYFGTQPSVGSNAWHHFGLTYDGSNLALFLDGSQLQQVPLTGALKTGAPGLRIGDGGSTAGNTTGWNGAVDDFRIYSRALSPQDMASLWNKGAPQGTTTWTALDLTGAARLTGNLCLYQPPGRVNPEAAVRVQAVRASTSAAGTAQSGIVFGATDAGVAAGTAQKGGMWYQEGTTGFGRGNLLLCQNSNSDSTNAGPGNAAVTLTNGGFVGVGTTSPAYPLDITGTARINSAVSGSGGLVCSLTSDAANPTVHLLNYSHDNIQLLFDSYYNGAAILASSATGSARLTKSGGALGLWVASNVPVGSNAPFQATASLAIPCATGFVGINTSTPAYTLDVAGTGNFQAVSVSGAASAGSFTVSGGISTGSLTASGGISTGSLYVGGGSTLQLGDSSIYDTGASGRVTTNQNGTITCYLLDQQAVVGNGQVYTKAGNSSDYLLMMDSGNNACKLDAMNGGQAAGRQLFLNSKFGGDIVVNGNTYPNSDNTRSLGLSGNRWSTVWSASQSNTAGLSSGSVSTGSLSVSGSTATASLSVSGSTATSNLAASGTVTSPNLTVSGATKTGSLVNGTECYFSAVGSASTSNYTGGTGPSAITQLHLCNFCQWPLVCHNFCCVSGS
jgi:hypothetical protein